MGDLEPGGYELALARMREIHSSAEWRSWWSAQTFIVEYPVVLAAEAVADDLKFHRDGAQVFLLSEPPKCPAKRMIIVAPFLVDGEAKCATYSIEEAGRRLTLFVQHPFDLPEPALGLDIETGRILFYPKPIGMLESDWLIILRTILCSVIAILNLINSPRIVRREPAITRQQRRALQRGGFATVDAWYRVSWNVDQPVLSKSSRDPDFHKMPLHFRRGHWRSAEPHYRRAALIQGRWRQWIDGQWVGHPAFGIKKSYHQPRVSA